jgi:hypothetical protein
LRIFERSLSEESSNLYFDIFHTTLYKAAQKPINSKQKLVIFLNLGDRDRSHGLNSSNWFSHMGEIQRQH